MLGLKKKTLEDRNMLLHYFVVKYMGYILKKNSLYQDMLSVSKLCCLYMFMFEQLVKWLLYILNLLYIFLLWMPNFFNFKIATYLWKLNDVFRYKEIISWVLLSSG